MAHVLAATARLAAVGERITERDAPPRPVGPLALDRLPRTQLAAQLGGQAATPYATLVGADLIKLEEGLGSAKKLRRFLSEHPAFIWLLGFPLVPAPNPPLGFNTLRSLPTQRHFNRLLRTLPNSMLQCLLADSVRLILAELQTVGHTRLDCISLDTKHILAWVKENNPKAYVSDCFDKNKQPSGDPDCKLGCKRRRARHTHAQSQARRLVESR